MTKGRSLVSRNDGQSAGSEGRIRRWLVRDTSGLHRILGNIAWLVSEKLVRLCVGLFVGVWVARYLGPENFGLLSYSLALVMMFGNVAGLGLDSIVVRDIVNERESRGETLGTAFVLKAGASIGA